MPANLENSAVATGLDTLYISLNEWFMQCPQLPKLAHLRVYPEYLLEGLKLKLKLQYFGHVM